MQRRDADGFGAADVANLIVDEERLLGHRPKSLEPKLVRARIGLEDFCMGCVDNHINPLKRGNSFQPSRTMKELKLVTQYAGANAGTPGIVKQIDKFAAKPCQSAMSHARS